MKFHIRIYRQSFHVFRVAELCFSVLLVIALALTLKGCKRVDSCLIEDVYSKIRVNGESGHSKAWLQEHDVTLCARHLGRLETYKDKHACSSVKDVFPDGHLPDVLYGDSEALLLVRCPTASYPKAQVMQRVTCSTDIVFDPPDGPITRRLALHFDGADKASNCQLAVPDDAVATSTNHTNSRGSHDGPRSPPPHDMPLSSPPHDVPRSPPVDFLSQEHELQEDPRVANGNGSYAASNRLIVATVGADANPALLVEGQRAQLSRFSGRAPALSPDLEVVVDTLGATPTG